MVREDLLDLENRKNKAPGGYCTDFPASSRPFIFMNAVGLHDDVQTLLHESGHAFHVFETARLPYHQQTQVAHGICRSGFDGHGTAGCALPDQRPGWFLYDPADAARARIEHLESNHSLLAVHGRGGCLPALGLYPSTQAADPARCDEAWGSLWERFMPGVDWSGLEEYEVTGWQRKLHIFTEPFYYIEYGLAQLGAVQVWRNALKDQAAAVASYRQALALGGTVTLPQLFQAAGARLAFDSDTLGQAVSLAEKVIEASGEAHI